MLAFYIATSSHYSFKDKNTRIQKESKSKKQL